MIITGSLGDGIETTPLGPAPQPLPVAQPIDLAQADVPALADVASAPATDAQPVADGPALDLAPAPQNAQASATSEAPSEAQPASAEPMTLEIEAEPLFAMADAAELGLRSSDTPLSLDPPAIIEPEAPSEPSPEEVAALEGAPDVSADNPLPPSRQYNGEISVTGSTGSGPHMTLAGIVTRAATMNPEVTLALARVEEARSGVDQARSGLGPQVDVTLAAGQTATASYDPRDFDLNNRAANAEGRVDATVRLRQMLFDFNVTRDEIRATTAGADAAKLRAIGVTEDIALRTAQAYLRIFQQRQLLALIERNIQEHQRLLEIVELNEADGNSTLADVNRVSARLSEVRSARTDLAADLDAAEDAFQRLARIEPGRLEPPASVIAHLAPSADDAISRARSGNPQLLSLAYTVRAQQHQLDIVNGDGAARIDLELEANSKTYISGDPRTENDVRGMVVFSYSLFDSGQAAGEQREAEARIRQARARYTDARDQVEADIRQAYRAIASARRKLDDLRDGLASSREVQALYTQQFQGGERTIFELLDAQNALFSAEQELIVSQFSELEAAYSVLRSTGRLTSTILNQR